MKIIKPSLKISLLTIGAISCGLSAQATGMLQFQNTMLHPIEIIPDKSSGIDAIYVVYDTSEVSIKFVSSNPDAVKVYSYGNLGGGFAEEISNVQRQQDGVILSGDLGDTGYIFEDNGKRYYYWVVNYLPYRFRLQSASASDLSDCDATVIDVDGYAPAIYYYTITGQRKILSRDINVVYSTQEWDSSRMEYIEKEIEDTIEYFDTSIRITPAPYCYTPFHISGDRFLNEWNWGIEIETPTIAPTAVSVMTEAVQNGVSNIGSSDSTVDADITESDSDDDADGSNIIKGDDSALGGSAPAEISFNAYITQGVMHCEWQLSTDPEFETVDYRFTEQNLDYTFMDEGTFYLRFIGSNSDGTCEAIGDTYVVSIGASELLCPNAFSPDGDGVNDIWKVSYRSIVDFDCWIFDRYGSQIFHFTDPSAGWDGKRNGKTVKSGVYYYVITATGADGKKYKKSGDINILLRRSVSNSGTGNEDTLQ